MGWEELAITGLTAAVGALAGWILSQERRVSKVETTLEIAVEFSKKMEARMAKLQDDTHAFIVKHASRRKHD